MKVFITEYVVSGIKSIVKPITLSFYKKNITRPFDTQPYNVKGIYGMNGSGKSGIITSVRILKNILINPNYLSNPIVQGILQETINRQSRQLDVSVKFVVQMNNDTKLHNYSFTLKPDNTDSYVISKEELYVRNAYSRTQQWQLVYRCENGILYEGEHDFVFIERFKNMTMNLLLKASFCSLLYTKMTEEMEQQLQKSEKKSLDTLLNTLVFGISIHTFVEDSDDHTQDTIIKFISHSMDVFPQIKSDFAQMLKEREIRTVRSIIPEGQRVSQTDLDQYIANVHALLRFLQIFKPELLDLEVEKKFDGEDYHCSFKMVYDNYRIDPEYESTGIKKLIRLYTYLHTMVLGDIVFIDEFDSNLHDVYLCALLEYLMEYGKGQLCFTTHNVGPMDILKHNKKSIDFLSSANTVVPWHSNGNYSPSSLYRSGMIEGPIFNIEAIDFIGVFENTGENKWHNS